MNKPKFKIEIAPIFIFFILVYQKALSPFFRARCRFHPTCSQYAINALKTHGFLEGSWLAIKRLFKCRPFTEGGMDPVPLKIHINQQNSTSPTCEGEFHG